ncbi:MAG: hypothetical protein E6Q97_24330 [Desulfurellales bacterium]|nr:MAG: hypothetical protein E6Q97_24330 [Desulfurellales bacterium]
MLSVIRLACPALDPEAKARVQFYGSRVILPDDKCHPLQSLLDERIVKESLENSLPAPFWARSSERQFAVKLTPSVIDRTRYELIPLGYANRRKGAKFLNSHLLGEEGDHKLGNLTVFIEDKT